MAVLLRYVELRETSVGVIVGLVDDLLHDQRDATREAVHLKASACHLAVLIRRFVSRLGQDRGHIGNVVRVFNFGEFHRAGA